MTPAEVLAGRGRWAVVEGDALALLASLPDGCVDALVTDPPAGIGFMGRGWDTDKGGRGTWIAWLAAILRECRRVLKPGGHALVWALPRTSHWTATAVEDAGFEVRDVVVHMFGQGFPKSLDVSKAIDAAAGAEREVVGYTNPSDPMQSGRTAATGIAGGQGRTLEPLPITAPATDAARQWSGWGTALKPAAEHWILARKPLAGTVAANVLEHGTGAINVDGCRVEWTGAKSGWSASGSHASPNVAMSGGNTERAPKPDAPGRWPANVVLSHECAAACVPDCAVRLLDEQSGELPRSGDRICRPGTPKAGAVFGPYGASDGGARAGDSGGASRFYYVAKVDPREAEAGCHDLPPRTPAEITGRVDGSAGLDNPRAGVASGARRNHHPTRKPVELMRWLCRLVTPPGGVVLDPFAGCGTTGCACMVEHFRIVGGDLDPDYVAIARARLAHWERYGGLSASPEATAAARAGQTMLFPAGSDRQAPLFPEDDS